MDYIKMIEELKNKEVAIGLEKNGTVNTILKKTDKEGRDKLYFRVYWYDKKMRRDVSDGYCFRFSNAKGQKRLFELNWKILS